MSLTVTSVEAVTRVRVLDGFQLELQFDHGETRKRRQLPLATLDRKLREACAVAGVPVLP